MQTWFEFYAVMGGAAATLMGLLFVAVSINAAAILSEAHRNARRLAEQAFQNYFAVLLVSLLALFPSLKITEVGYTTLGVIAVSCVWTIVRLYWAMTEPYGPGERLQALRRQFASLLGFGILIFAALRMVLDWGESRSLFAAGTLVLLFSATAVSWELLLRIAGARTPK